ncbi:MAG: hypothetical protein JXM74_01950 [Fusobacteriaceae bacterium]|nr:hypothetical protein [Fusobacteriaceae bacterium]MBN2837498.1 hypothetical protein [Fusobacteriaceae bacterium]
MKRTATLVAGLLLVTGTVFAEGKLDFSGTVIKANTKLIEKNYEAVNDDSNGDTDIILKVNYDLGNNTTATFKFDTDSEDDTYDNNMNIMVKTVQGKVEAQFDAGLDFNDSSKGSVAFKENQDSSDTYIKYNYTDNMSVAFYPFNMGLKNGSEFDKGDHYTEIPGVVLTSGKSYVGFGMDEVEYLKKNGTDDYSSKIDSVMAVKAGTTFETDKVKLSLKYSGVFFGDEIKNAYYGTDANANDNYEDTEVTRAIIGEKSFVATGGNLGLVTNDINAKAEVKVTDKIKVNAEVGMVTLADDLELTSYNENGTATGTSKEDSGFGLFVKGSYALSDVVTPYVKLKHSTDGFVAYGDMRDWNGVKNSLTGEKTDGVTEVSLGTDYKLTEKLVLNGEFTFKNAGNYIFEDKTSDTTKYSKTNYTLAASATFTF